VRDVSTPPFVDLPSSLTVERWPVRGSHRAVLRTRLAPTDRWCVLVPGFTGSKEDFIAVLPLLADAGVAAVSYDQLGQHESDGSDDPDDYDIAALALDLASVVDDAVDRLGFTTPPLLVGHSFGGLVAQRAVADGLDLCGFVALCTGPGGLPPHRHGGLQDLVEALPHTDMAAIWEIMRAQAAAAGEQPVAPSVREFLSRRWLNNDPHQIREFAHQLMTATAVIAPIRDRVTEGLPVTVMFGELDDAWPLEVQREMAREWGVPVVQLDGLGHSPNAQGPEQLVAALLSALRG
jgi:pimeloyl-ACP methyl ester carboxylesterase